MINQLLPMVLNPGNLESVNKNIREDLAKYELLPGELQPFITIAPGEKEMALAVITLKEIPEPENPEKTITVFSRTLEKKSFSDFVKGLIGAKK